MPAQDLHHDAVIVKKNKIQMLVVYIDAVVFHLRIRNGKIWVEDDWTEYGVAGELVDAGIAKEEIVLGFHSAKKRPLTEFAVA
jgi:hypothetical protein